MTTAHCAALINELVGERLVDDRYIRERVERGELRPLNPNKLPRERYKIGTAEFLRYVQANHNTLFERLRERLEPAA